MLTIIFIVLALIVIVAVFWLLRAHLATTKAIEDRLDRFARQQLSLVATKLGMIESKLGLIHLAVTHPPVAPAAPSAAAKPRPAKPSRS